MKPEISDNRKNITISKYLIQSNSIFSFLIIFPRVSRPGGRSYRRGSVFAWVFPQDSEIPSTEFSLLYWQRIGIIKDKEP